MRKLSVPNDFFADAAEALRQGQTVKLRIGGQSMYPFIRGGVDVVEVAPCPPEGELPAWCCPFYRWEGRYMIHRHIGSEGDDCLMLGDGNIARIERVKRKDIIGLLKTIHRPDGTTQDCRDARWLKKAEWWYRLRYLRRWLLPIMKMLPPNCVIFTPKAKINCTSAKKRNKFILFCIRFALSLSSELR